MRPKPFSPICSTNHSSRSGQAGGTAGLVLRACFLSAALAVAAVAAGCDDETAGPDHQHQTSLLTMSQSSLDLEPGQQAQLGVKAVCGCGDQIEVSVVWESDNRSVATVSLAGLVTAVGSGSATITAKAAGLRATAMVTVPEQLGYSLQAVTPGVEILQLGEGHIPIRIARTGGFSGAVTLTAEAVPAGLGVTFSDGVISDNMAEVFFTAGDPLPAGTHTVTVMGSAEGLVPQTVQVAVNVVKPETGDVLLKPDPEWITVGRGSAGTTEILVTRTPTFSWGWIGLDIDNAPAGFTWDFVPPDGFEFTTSTLTIWVAPEVKAGSYTLAIQGVFEVWGDERWTHVHVTVIDLPVLPETPRR